jgi:two-component system, chemotaxis family, chemotaxis protein CheY
MEASMKLLIVDDSNMIRSRISRVVAAGGLKGVAIVGLAKNGVEALRIAQATNPDVITIDLTMPEMDGIECIPQLIAQNPAYSILVVSALADRTTAIEALRLGARGFVAKPFSDHELLSALMDMKT